MIINQYKVFFVVLAFLIIDENVSAQKASSADTSGFRSLIPSDTTKKIDTIYSSFILSLMPSDTIAKINTAKGGKAKRSECSLADSLRQFIQDYDSSFTYVLTVRDTSVINIMIKRLTGINNKADGINLSFIFHRKRYLINATYFPVIEELEEELQNYIAYLKVKSFDFLQDTITYNSIDNCCNTSFTEFTGMKTPYFFGDMSTELNISDKALYNSLSDIICCNSKQITYVLDTNLKRTFLYLSRQHKKIIERIDTLYLQGIFFDLRRKYIKLIQAEKELGKDCTNVKP
jgi:hypothetical protein